MVPPLKIELYLKGRLLRAMTFAQDEIRVGRDPNADIFMDNASVSRQHCCMQLRHQSVVVRDLESANGTFVNNERIQEAFAVHGDNIGVGKFVLKLNFNVDASEQIGGPTNPVIKQGPIVPSSTVQVAPSELQSMREATARISTAELNRSLARSARSMRPPAWIPWLLVFLLGSILGAGVLWLLL